MNENMYHNGLAPDLRTEVQKAKDYTLPAGAIILNWVEKTPDQWKKYTPREQDGSLSCMAQAGAKAMEILGYGVVSAHPPYRSRANFPEGGMYNADLGSVYKKVGTTTEVLDVSQWQNESTMNKVITITTPIKSGGYFFPNVNIDSIAEAIELYKHCIILIHCNKSEYTKPIPVYNGLPIDFGHGICAVDYFLYKGEKVILLEDSTGHSSSFDGEGQRLITEDFLNKRCAGAIYFIKNLAVIPYVFTAFLKIGSVGLPTKMLQTKLGVNSDGIFGRKTQLAVLAFQTSHHLVADGICGPKTNAILNLW